MNLKVFCRLVLEIFTHLGVHTAHQPAQRQYLQFFGQRVKNYFVFEMLLNFVIFFVVIVFCVLCVM